MAFPDFIIDRFRINRDMCFSSRLAGVTRSGRDLVPADWMQAGAKTAPK